MMDNLPGNATGNSLSKDGIRALFGYRDYRLIWIGRNCSRLGDSIYEIAIAWTVYSLTGSSVAMGTMLAVYTTPQLALMLFGGVVGDRWHRRSILLVTDALSAGLVGLLGFLLAVHSLNMTVLLVSAACLGALSAFSRPALTPLIGDLLPPQLLKKGNSVDSATFSVATFLGPAIGGLLAKWNLQSALFLDAFTFGISFVCLYYVSARNRTVKTEFKSVVLDELREGLRYSARQGWILWVTGFSALLNIVCVAPFYVLLPLRLKQEGISADIYGLALAMQGLCAVFTSLLLVRIRTLPRGDWLIIAPSSGLAVGVGLLAIAHSNFLFLLAGASMGTSVAAGFAVNLLIQTTIEPQMRSRVTSVMMLGTFAPLPFAYLVSGVVANHLGVPATTAGSGIFGIGICVAAQLTPTFRTPPMAQIEQK
jgi:MFS family permease